MIRKYVDICNRFDCAKNYNYDIRPESSAFGVVFAIKMNQNYCQNQYA
ncbi:MAG: hypothetical protein RR346_06060 [Bacteroidales bacterium]